MRYIICPNSQIIDKIVSLLITDFRLVYIDNIYNDKIDESMVNFEDTISNIFNKDTISYEHYNDVILISRITIPYLVSNSVINTLGIQSLIDDISISPNMDVIHDYRNLIKLLTITNPNTIHVLVDSIIEWIKG